MIIHATAKLSDSCNIRTLPKPYGPQWKMLLFFNHHPYDMVKLECLQEPRTPSLNTQSCNRRPLCSTFRFENLRSPKKNRFKIHNYFLKKKFKIFLTSFYTTFQCGRYNVFKKILDFFCPQKHRQTAFKSCT